MKPLTWIIAALLVVSTQAFAAPWLVSNPTTENYYDRCAYQVGATTPITMALDAGACKIDLSVFAQGATHTLAVYFISTPWSNTESARVSYTFTRPHSNSPAPANVRIEQSRLVSDPALPNMWNRCAYQVGVNSPQAGPLVANACNLSLDSFFPGTTNTVDVYFISDDWGVESQRVTFTFTKPQPSGSGPAPSNLHIEP